MTTESAHTGRYALKWDFGQAKGKGSLYEGRRYLIVNVAIPKEAIPKVRGKRVKVGLWYQPGSGSLSPDIVVRPAGKNGIIGGFGVPGGVDDPAGWNRFETEGRIPPETESMDIHIACVVPSEAAVAAKSMFYIDDVFMQPIEEPPVAVSSAFDEYYLGQSIRWSVFLADGAGPITVALLSGDQVVAEVPCPAQKPPFEGDVRQQGAQARHLHAARDRRQGPAGRADRRAPSDTLAESVRLVGCRERRRRRSDSSAASAFPLDVHATSAPPWGRLARRVAKGPTS